jgi:type IX secretion system PorP/SprF family membrane protein
MVFDIIAQQDPQYSQYMFNQMAVNPGYVGSNEAICLNAVHRQQWVGIEGAPVTSVFTVNAPFKIKETNHGFGLVVMNDQVGFDNNVSAGLDYAFRFKPTQAPGKIGIGISGMFLNKALKATWKTPGGVGAEADPSIPGANESIVGFDLGLGVYYRSEIVSLGISSMHLLEPNMSFDEKPNAKYTLTRHYYATAGCLLPLKNPVWEVAPSIMIFSDGTSSQFTANMNLMYNKKIWGGIGYRLNDSFIAMIGFDLFNGLKIGYAFDYTYTSLHSHFSAGGSHEIMLGYCFNLVKEKVVKKYKSVRYL